MAPRKAPSRARTARARSNSRKQPAAPRKKARAVGAAKRTGKSRASTPKKPAARPSARTSRPGKKTGSARKTTRTPASGLQVKAKKKVKAKAKPSRPGRAATRSKPATKQAPGAHKSTASRRRPGTVRAETPSPTRLGPPPGLARQRRQLADVERDSAAAIDNRMDASDRTDRDALSELLGHRVDPSPALAAGDVDARWNDAYAVGDEAPGGDNPTPDQDRVDDIGKALGVNYDDNEELRGSDKISDRDRHRWEYDPASSDDWPHNRD